MTSEEKALALPSPPGKVRPMTEFGRWENEPESDWGIDDLDTEEIVRTVEKAIDLGRLEALDTRDPLVLLRDLGLTKEDALLRAAVVLFGKKDRLSAEYTQCTVRAARFPGTEKSEFLDNRQFRGNALSCWPAVSVLFGNTSASLVGSSRTASCESTSRRIRLLLCAKRW